MKVLLSTSLRISDLTLLCDTKVLSLSSRSMSEATTLSSMVRFVLFLA
jgi:hypothetical protein